MLYFNFFIPSDQVGVGAFVEVFRACADAYRDRCAIPLRALFCTSAAPAFDDDLLTCGARCQGKVLQCLPGCAGRSARDWFWLSFRSLECARALKQAAFWLAAQPNTSDMLKTRKSLNARRSLASNQKGTFSYWTMRPDSGTRSSLGMASFSI